MEAWREAAKNRRALLKREAALVGEIDRLYARSDKLLRVRLTALTRELKGLDLMDAPARFFQREKVQTLLREIKTTLDRNAPAMAQRVTEAQAEGLTAGLADTAWIGRARLVANWIRLPVDELQALVGFTADGMPLAQRFLREGAEAAAKAREVLFDGILNGRGSRVIGRQLQQAVRTLSRGNAVLIARTESHRAYRTATIQSYAHNSHVTRGWRWLCSKDARSCPACLALDGTVHPLSEHFGSHPACRCTAQPVLIGRDLDYGPTGQEWFAEQPAGVQRKILGPARHRLYEAGKLKLPDLVHRVPSIWGPTAGVKSLKSLVNDGIITAEDVLGARKRAA